MHQKEKRRIEEYSGSGKTNWENVIMGKFYENQLCILM